VVVVVAAVDVEVEERGTVVEVEGWVAGDPVQDASIATTSTAGSTAGDRLRFLWLSPTAACPVLG